MKHPILYSILFFTMTVVFLSCGDSESDETRAAITCHQIWTNEGAVHSSKPDSTLLAPDIAYPELGGGEFRLSEHRGKVIVLNLWGTWCGPCIAEIPDFVALQEEFRERDVEFVGISLDEQGWDVVRPFVEKHDINYRILLDREGSVVETYPINGLPQTYIINKRGEVAHVIHSRTSKELLRPLLSHLAGM
jgi:peroxiredoxin